MGKLYIKGGIVKTAQTDEAYKLALKNGAKAFTPKKTKATK